MNRRFFFTLICCLFSLWSWSKVNYCPSDMDSLNYDYYKEILCIGNVKETLSMADTLFEKGKKSKDTKAQCLSILCKLNYYYFKRAPLDSIHHYVKQLQFFSRKVNRPRYYYFAYSRKISLYTKKMMLNTAVKEAQKMLKEAQKENYEQGIIEAYKVLANVHLINKEYDLSLIMFKKSIAYMEDNAIDYQNAYILYLSIANLYLKQDSLKQAKYYITQSETYAHSELRIAAINLSRCILASREHRFKDAKDTLELLNSYKSPIIKKKRKTAEREYYVNLYLHKKQYNNLVTYLEPRVKNQRDNSHKITLLQTLAKAYSLNKQYKKAAVTFERTYALRERLLAFTEKADIAKANADLDNARLEKEKQNLKAKIQGKTIESLRIATISACIFLLVVFLFILLLRRRIKQLHRIRHELIVANKNIVHLSHLKTTFIRSISHEIRTPLNLITGFSTVLSDKYKTDKETQEYAKIIQEGSHQLTSTINNLIDISSLDKVNEPLSIEKVDLNKLCTSCIDEANIRKKEGVVICFKPAKEPSFILSNYNAITQILRNLLSNACHFTREGTISVSYKLDCKEKNILFTVTDTGTGICPEIQQIIYQRFSKGDAFTEGLGLGLSICQVLIHRLRGRIDLDLNYNLGTCFIVSLPYVKAASSLDKKRVM